MQASSGVRRRPRGTGRYLDLPVLPHPRPAPRVPASSRPAVEGSRTDRTESLGRRLPGGDVLEEAAAAVACALWDVHLAIQAAGPPACGDGSQTRPTEPDWHVEMRGSWPWPATGSVGPDRRQSAGLGRGANVDDDVDDDDVCSVGRVSTHSRRQ